MLYIMLYINYIYIKEFYVICYILYIIYYSYINEFYV